jgi:hypothetical protein
MNSLLSRVKSSPVAVRVVSFPRICLPDGNPILVRSRWGILDLPG